MSQTALIGKVLQAAEVMAHLGSHDGNLPEEHSEAKAAYDHLQLTRRFLLEFAGHLQGGLSAGEAFLTTARATSPLTRGEGKALQAMQPPAEDA